MLIRNEKTLIFVLLMALLSSCGKNPDQSRSVDIKRSADQELPAESQAYSIKSGDCAVILNNVKSAGEISIDQNCDVPSEKKIIKLLFDSEFTNECYFAWPKSWIRIDSSPEIQFIATPQPGDYFSKYQFQYTTEPSSTSLSEDIFISAEEDGYYEHQLKNKSVVSEQEFNKILALREKNAGFIIQNRILDEIIGMNEARKNVGTFSLRSKIAYEDGSSVESETIDVLSKDHKIFASVSVFPTPNGSPNFSVINDKPTGYTFSCEASDKMDVSIFSSLCSSLIEKATLNAKYPSSQCEPTETGLKFHVDS